MNYYTSHFLNPHGSCKPCQRRLRSYKGHNALSLRGIPVGQGPLRPFLSCIVSLTHIDSKEPQRQKHLFGGGSYVASRTPHVRFPADRRGRHKPVEAFRAGPSDGTPVHPRAVNVLYLMYLCSCLVERTWRFALPLVLAHLEGGFQAIAVLGFVSPLAWSLLGPAAGRLLDRLYRPYGLGVMIALQSFAVTASGLVVLITARNPALAITEGPLYALLLLFSMLERLTAIASELVIERDWVTQLAGKDNAMALARSNAMLRRTDLTCELIGSLAFGWLYSTAGITISVASATTLAICMLPIQITCIYWIAKLAPDAMVHGRDEASSAMFRPPWKRLLGLHPGLDNHVSATPLSVKIRNQLLKSLDGWKAYFRQPVLPSSLTFVILFFNVALSPGGLITAFLTLKGLDGTAMAVFRGGCAMMGFGGTWVGRRLIQKLGLLGAGKRALTIQATFLGLATLIYAISLSAPLVTDASLAPGVPGTGIPFGLIAFSLAVVCSRVGMWSFDMVNAQLFQQTVSQREIASASAAEMALCSFSELFMLGLAAYVITPASYSALIYASFGAVIAANMVYRWWATRVRDYEEDLPAMLASSAA